MCPKSMHPVCMPKAVSAAASHCFRRRIDSHSQLSATLFLTSSSSFKLLDIRAKMTAPKAVAENMLWGGRFTREPQPLCRFN